MYLDGHERPDVVSERRAFCKTMLDLAEHMESYEGDTELQTIPATPSADGKTYVIVTQDESIFMSHDGQ
jgi:hypothetical protein